MNQRNAIPAIGIRFSAKPVDLTSLASHAPGSSGSAGTDWRNNQNTKRKRTEKTIPAIAAAFGVFRFARVTAESGNIDNPAWTPAPGISVRKRERGAGVHRRKERPPHTTPTGTEPNPRVTSG